MSQFVPPTNVRPVLLTPASFENNTQLAVYDGFPDGQPWAQELVTRAQVSSNPYELEFILELANQETGAPIGPFVSESYRVSRAVGVITSTDKVEASAKTDVAGVAVAQGVCCASWRDTPAGRFLVVEFHAPHAIGWGVGRSSLCQEHLKARCLYQYAHQAKSLLEHTEGCETAESLLTEFIGEWGPETENIRRGLAMTCILYWSEASTKSPLTTECSEDPGISELVKLAA